MADVILHIYDVTNSGSDKTNTTIVHINKIFKDRIGLGGIFHSAIQIYGDDEWSFGFCKEGSGVFSCPSGKNPLYKYRESMFLGRTSFSIFMVNHMLREFSREWPGTSYDLLSRNCNHFCDELCERLGVQKLPGWVNRFAHTGDAAVEMVENTALRLKQAKTEIVSAGKEAYRFVVGVQTGSSGHSDSPRSTNRGSPRFQAAWFKKIISTSIKPSSTSKIETQDDDVVLQHQQLHASEQTTR